MVEFGKGALKINYKQTGYLESSNIEVNLSKDKNLSTNRGARGRIFYSTACEPKDSSTPFPVYTKGYHPLKIYENLEEDKLIIYSDSKDKCGVYL